MIKINIPDRLWWLYSWKLFPLAIKQRVGKLNFYVELYWR